MPERVPFDIAAYEQEDLTGGCVICRILAGEPGRLPMEASELVEAIRSALAD
jgi:hypothetical protein